MLVEVLQFPPPGTPLGLVLAPDGHLAQLSSEQVVVETLVAVGSTAQAGGVLQHVLLQAALAVRHLAAGQQAGVAQDPVAGGTVDLERARGACGIGKGWRQLDLAAIPPRGQCWGGGGGGGS